MALFLIYHSPPVKMNLASRCREAISHVAMLKKELAMHQKRAQEAIKFQREQTQRMASNLSAEASRLSASYSEGDSSISTPDRRSGMERILATPPPPPPPPRATTNHHKQEVESRKLDPPVLASQEDDGNISSETSEEEDPLHSVSRQGRSVLDVVESLSASPIEEVEPIPSKGSLPPRMYSTPNRHRKEDRWTPHIHDAPGSVANEKPLFPTSASPKVPNYNEEFPSDIVRSSSPLSHLTGGKGLYDDDKSDEGSQRGPTLLDRHSGFITMNSIDAFEASFDTTFPSNFSSSRRSITETQIYNPFDASPARSAMQGQRDTSPEPFSPHADFSTPPKESPTTAEVEPPRPHKTPSSEARTRYDKAIQPRPQENSASTSDAVAPEKERNGFLGSSPGKFLNRIQLLRKGKEDTSPIESSASQRSPSDSSRKQENVAPSTSPRPMPQKQPSRKAQASVEEIAVASDATSVAEVLGRPGGMVARLNTLKQKRAVKQPISYAEPPLNTKIRQGHTNFLKEPLRTVTPEQVRSPSGV